MQVKINGKNYNVPELTFGAMAKMESITGESIATVFEREQFFLLAEAFTGVVADCDKEQADYLLEQHVLGGGDISDIYKVLMQAVNESAFFKKLLGIEEKPKKSTQKKLEQATTTE